MVSGVAKAHYDLSDWRGKAESPGFDLKESNEHEWNGRFGI